MASPTLPALSKAYGSTTYQSPDGLLWFGTIALQFSSVYTKEAVDELIAGIGGNLQGVTTGTGNNYTTNGIQVGGFSNIDLTKNSIVAYNTGAGTSYLSNLFSGTETGLLELNTTNSVLSFGTSLLGVRAETSGSAGTYTNTRLQIVDAINPNDAVALGQVIVNSTTLQASSNFNISGIGKMATLNLSTLPVDRSEATASVLVRNLTTGAIEKVPGSAADVVRANGTVLNFESGVRSTLLQGLPAGTNTPITTSNTVLNGMANLQAQISAIPVPNLQNVLTAGYTANKAIRLTVTSDDYTAIDGLYLKVEPDDGFQKAGFGFKNPASTGAGIKFEMIQYDSDIIPSQMSVSVDDESGFRLMKPSTNSGLVMEFSGKVQGVDATSNNQFVTLGQLSGYAKLTGNNDFTGGGTQIYYDSSSAIGAVINPGAGLVGVQNGADTRFTQLQLDGIYFNTHGAIGNAYAVLKSDNLTGSGTVRVLQAPNASGTLALTNDLAGYVTIATSQTVTGNKDFSGNINFYGTTFDVDNDNISLAKINVNGRGGGSPLKPFMIMNPAGTTNVSPTSTDIPSGFDAWVLYGKRIANGTSHLSWKTRKVGSTDIEDYGATIIQNGLTADREYTLPNASGTIALIGDLSGYAKLVGGNNYTGGGQQVYFSADMKSVTIDPNSSYINIQTSSADRRYVNIGLDGISFSTYATADGYATFKTDNITTNVERVLQVPNASGTLALKGDILYGATVVTMNGTDTVFNIPHGMGAVPTSFAISFGDAGNENFVKSVRTLSSTNITLTCADAPVAGSQTVYWQVFR